MEQYRERRRGCMVDLMDNPICLVPRSQVEEFYDLNCIFHGKGCGFRSTRDHTTILWPDISTALRQILLPLPKHSMTMHTESAASLALTSALEISLTVVRNVVW